MLCEESASGVADTLSFQCLFDCLYSLLDIFPVLGAVDERDMAVEMVDWYWSRQESKASL